MVEDPLYTDDELRALGFAPYVGGSSVEAAILQADHPEYASLNPSNFPGIKAIYDGRSMLDPSAWADVAYIRIGVG